MMQLEDRTMASRALQARFTYVGPMTVRPRYYAFNSSQTSDLVDADSIMDTPGKPE
jgi:hypothetical protein